MRRSADAVPHRDALEAAFDPASDVPGCGPYALRTSLLVRRNAAVIRQLLARYDGLVARARPQRGRAVFTHGEPYPGNTMLTADGWVLIDWDTALVVPAGAGPVPDRSRRWDHARRLRQRDRRHPDTGPRRGVPAPLGHR